MKPLLKILLVVSILLGVTLYAVQQPTVGSRPVVLETGGQTTNIMIVGGTVSGQTNTDLTASVVMASDANKRPSSSTLTLAEANALHTTPPYVPGGTDVAVPDGGTGVSSLTSYAPVFGGTNSTGPMQSGGIGTAGQVLTSGGPGVLPSFQNAPAGYVAPQRIILTDAATIATDASLTVTNGGVFQVTLGGDRILGVPTNPTDGQQCKWVFIQDATGNRTLAVTNVVFSFGTDITGITLTTNATKRDFMTAIYDSTATVWRVVGFVRGY